MKQFLSIDPGTTESAYLEWDRAKIGLRYVTITLLIRHQKRKLAWRRFHQKNREKRNFETRCYRVNNKAKHSERMRIYRNKNPDVIQRIESNRKRPADYKEKFSIYKKQWKKNNPDRVLAYYQKRRAALTGSSLQPHEISSLRISQDGKCGYCSNQLDNKGRGHLDHKTPLNRGGKNEIQNVIFACSKCNLRKGEKTAEEFIRSMEEL